MVGQGSPWRVWLVIGAVAGWGAMSDATGLAQTHRSTPVMREDAELADVFFLDPDRGWAVGDRGAIWATDNGGRHWRMQMSGVEAGVVARVTSLGKSYLSPNSMVSMTDILVWMVPWILLGIGLFLSVS